MGTASPTSALLSLPTELLDDIVSRLAQTEDLRNVVRTCQRLHQVAAPVLYAHICLGYYGENDTHPQQRSPEETYKVLKMLGNPMLARHVVFLDHLDSPLPTFTRISSQRPMPRDLVPAAHPVFLPDPLLETNIGASNGQAPPAPPPLIPPQRTIFRRADLEEQLNAAMTNLYKAWIQTIRIVSGSDSLIQALLEYVIKRSCVRKLWLEDVPLQFLASFLEKSPGVRDGNFTTGLTHLRMRKLKDRYSSRLIGDCIPQFLATIVTHSPNLTSLALDSVGCLENLPELLDTVTLPSLIAFQLRCQTDDRCITPYYLTDRRMLNFLLRHKRIKAFAWPAENFVSSDLGGKILEPLIWQFSRTLVWFRTDCTLIDSVTYLQQSRYSGPPKESRRFIASFLRRMEMIETIKLQGDYQKDELLEIHNAIAASGSSARMKKYSLIRSEVDEDLLAGMVAAMPNLHQLKLCAYFTPGLISFYGIAPQMVQESDDTFRANITLDKFLSYICGMKHLRWLTMPLHIGLDIQDQVVSDIWDEYREQHPASADFASHPHCKPLAAEIDMGAPPLSEVQTRMLDHGIQQHVVRDPDAAAVHPPTVVRTLLKSLRKASRLGGGLLELRTVRCFFILALSRSSLDIDEFLVDVEARKVERGTDLVGGMETLGLREEEQRMELELKRKPVLAYGWGTRLWLGETKPLRERSWF